LSEYTNFIKINAGHIADGVLYRCSSPLKGGYAKKAKGALAVKAGIKCILNLDDHSSVIEKLSETVPWYHELVKNKNVICLYMGFPIPGSVLNEKKLKTALQFMIAHEGPYLIHCFAGVDRTGFVIALLEALMGASPKEICSDYLSAFITDYRNLYRFEYYEKIKKLINQFEKMSHGITITDENIQFLAEQYLLNDIQLSQEEIEKLKGILGISN
jgi:protein tyrosine/serine phosphatase